MTSPDYWDEAKDALSARDQTLKKLIRNYAGEVMQLRPDPFFTLARSIVGQQISVKAAASVWKRVIDAVDMDAATISVTSESTLRGCGLSARKVQYMHALSAYFLSNQSIINNWSNMDDEAIIKELTSIKGIGRWSAEMFLIFHLGRPDIWPIADIGLQKAVSRHYNNDIQVSPPELRTIGEQWKPWRSVATWYLWRALDPMPVAY